MLMADVFAYASGLLLLAHTRRIALFALDARQLMQAHLRGLTETGGRERLPPLRWQRSESAG
jgi:hypothetical protein